MSSGYVDFSASIDKLVQFDYVKSKFCVNIMGVIYKEGHIPTQYIKLADLSTWLYYLRMKFEFVEICICGDLHGIYQLV